MASIVSNNSEAKASELLETTEYMFPQYYMHSDVFNMFNYVVSLIKSLPVIL